MIEQTEQKSVFVEKPTSIFQRLLNFKKGRDKDHTKDGKEDDVGGNGLIQAENPVSYIELFRFANRNQRYLTLLGVLASILNGLPMPIMLLIYGGTMDDFVPTDFCDYLDYINISSICPPHVDETNINQFYMECNWTGFNFTIPDLTSSIGERAGQFAIIGAVTWVLSSLQTMLLSNSAERIMRNVRCALFKSIMFKKVEWFDETSAGSINSIISDTTEKFKPGVGDKIGMVCQGVLVVVACLIVSISSGWKLSLVMLATAPVIIVIISYLTKQMTKDTFAETKAYGSAGNVAQETFSNIRSVHAYNGNAFMQNLYEDKLQTAYKKALIKGSLVSFAVGAMWFIVFASYALGFWYGGQLLVSDNMTVGLILIIFFGIQSAVFTIGGNVPHYSAITESRSAAASIYKIIDGGQREVISDPIVAQIDVKDKLSEIPNSDDDFITFDDVHFSYPSRSDVKVLNGLSFSIRKGSTVALVGESGCGKSTVIQLLLKFYDPSSGVITVNGKNIADTDIDVLRSSVGLVSQEPILFSDTIKENIRLGKPSATEDEIKKACQLANASGFIESFPEKYDTLVGESGSQLSGGQKQRIAIARALISDPPTLYLDEATSALDSESERVVQTALDEASKGRTTVIIAHRLSTIRNANIILGIDRGRVVEAGSHDELMAKNGLYAQLVNAQQTEETVGTGDNVKPTGQTDDRSDQDVFEDSRGSVSEPSKSDNAFRSHLKTKSRMSSMFTTAADEDTSSKGEESDLSKKAFLYVMKMNLPEVWFMVAGTILLITWGVLQVIFQLFFANVIVIFSSCDEKSRQERINLQSLRFFIIGLFCFICQFVGTSCFTFSGERLTTRIRTKLFKQLSRQEIGFFDDKENAVGKLCTALSVEASAVQGVTGIRIATILSGFSILFVGLVVALVYGWQLALVIVAFVPVLIGAGIVSMSVISGFSARDKKYLEEAGRIVIESTSNIRTVKQLRIEMHFFNKYMSLIDIVLQRNLRKTIVTGCLFGFSQGIVFFAIAACYYAGADFVTRGFMSTEAMMVVFGSLLFGAMSVGQSQAMAPEFGKSIDATKRIYKMLHRVPAIDAESTDGLIPSEYKGVYRLDDVAFSYPSRQGIKVLRGVSMNLDSTRSTALVGFSGCGKSTVTQLVERFYDPVEGTLFLDDRDVRTLNLQWYRQQLGIVSQEPILFNWSIRDNITFGDQLNSPSMERIRKAAKAANIDDFIINLPLGYDTVVGTKGSLLSGGQKQRICLARALIRNPKMLILDEATSALDSESERIVQEALVEAQKQRGSITIAHRLATIEHSDHIYVMDNGRIKEEGKHNELYDMKGIYYEMVKYSKR